MLEISTCKHSLGLYNISTKLYHKYHKFVAMVVYSLHMHDTSNSAKGNKYVMFCSIASLNKGTIFAGRLDFYLYMIMNNLGFANFSPSF